MLEIKDVEFSRKLRNNEVSPEELRDYLLKNFSVFELADELAGYLLEDLQYANNMIILTPVQDQLLERLFNRLIRLKHLDKGRKPKNEKTLKEREAIDEGLFR